MAVDQAPAESQKTTIQKIREFIAGEVQRQGFEVGTNDFSVRCSWMEQAWIFATRISLQQRLPSHRSVKSIGKRVERVANLGGWRKVNVRVGDWIAPDWSLVPHLMRDWSMAVDTMDPDYAYLQFEKIHPFIDGNGRTGKIIHNWLKGTLSDPVLVKDYFGHGVP